MLLLLVVPIMLFQHYQAQAAGGAGDDAAVPASLLTVLAFGYAFLYVPIILLIVYSFNNRSWSRCGAVSRTKWYGGLLQNQQMLGAAWLSAARRGAQRRPSRVMLGTMAGMALARFGRFRGPRAVRRHDDRAAGHAGSHHRAVAAAAVRCDGAADRLAGRARHD